MSDGDTHENWQVQTLRLTLFTSGLWPGSETIWRDLTTREPDIDENRVRESARRQIGREGDRQLETAVTPARTDVVMAPVVQDLLPATYFGSAQAEIREFVSLVSPWLDRIARVGNILRVAFGAVLLLPVENRGKSYQELGRLLPSVTIDPDNTTELLYRINRPAKYKDFQLNRLTTWSSVSVRRFIGLGSSLGQPSTPISEELFVRLEVDHSTPAERTEPLELGMIVPIFGELVEMALENASRGERP